MPFVVNQIMGTGTQSETSIHDQPYGVGIAYRYHLHEEVFHYGSEIDLLEIPTEDHIIRRRALSYPGAKEKFAQALDSFPCVAHGISMSLGSVEPADEKYFDSTCRFMRETGISVFSEHLAYHRMDGKDIASFLGMPMNDVSLDWLERRYDDAWDRLGCPFAVENVSLSFPVPASQYTEPQFLSEFLKRTDATLLLDVTNLYNNCTNYKQDPFEFLHALPPDRVSQIHLAGGHFDESGFLIDSHSFAVMDDVWELYAEALRYTAADIVIVERDYQCFPFREVMEDIRKARQIFYEIRPKNPHEVASDAGSLAAVSNGAPDHTAAEFANLRGFQRAVLKAITNDEFRNRVSSEPCDAAAAFPMSDDWLNRFAGCAKLDEMAMNWQETERLNQEDEERFRQWEWSQWATQT